MFQTPTHIWMFGSMQSLADPCQLTVVLTQHHKPGPEGTQPNQVHTADQHVVHPSQHVCIASSLAVKPTETHKIAIANAYQHPPQHSAVPVPSRPQV